MMVKGVVVAGITDGDWSFGGGRGLGSVNVHVLLIAGHVMAEDGGSAHEASGIDGGIEDTVAGRLDLDGRGGFIGFHDHDQVD